MSKYLDARIEYDTGDIIPILDEDRDNWYDWIIREKRLHSVSNQYIYFMTRPGFEGWFSHQYLRKHIFNNSNH